MLEIEQQIHVIISFHKKTRFELTSYVETLKCRKKWGSQKISKLELRFKEKKIKKYISSRNCSALRETSAVQQFNGFFYFIASVHWLVNVIRLTIFKIYKSIDTFQEFWLHFKNFEIILNKFKLKTNKTRIIFIFYHHYYHHQH